MSDSRQRAKDTAQAEMLRHFNNELKRRGLDPASSMDEVEEIIDAYHEKQDRSEGWKHS